MSENNEPRRSAAPDPDRIPQQHQTPPTPEPRATDARGRRRLRHVAGHRRRGDAALGGPGLGPERNPPRRRGRGLGAAQDLHRQRHRDHPGRPARPDPGRPAHRQHGQGGRAPRRATSSPGPPTSCPPSGPPPPAPTSRSSRARSSTPRGSGVGRTVRPADGNPHHRHPADHRRPRRRPGLPRGPVQHRCAGPDHHGRHPRRLGRLRAAPAGGAAPAAGPGRRHRRRRRLGRPRGRAQGQDRRP